MTDQSLLCSLFSKQSRGKKKKKKYCKILEVGVKNDTMFILTTATKKTYLIL